MNRRSFIKLGAMAAAALGLASRVAAEPEPILPPPGLAHFPPPRPSMLVGGDGTGAIYVIDPNCPRDSMYWYTRAHFDLKAHEPYQHAPIHNIKLLEEPPRAL